jgi:hypothetical protein
MKIPKQTLPNRGPLLISFLEKDTLQLPNHRRRQQTEEDKYTFRKTTPAVIMQR